MRVVLDTNVLISTLLWQGNLKPLYYLINERKIVLCFSPAISNEFRKVLHYPHILTKAKQLNLGIDALFEKVSTNSIRVFPKTITQVIKQDLSDNHFPDAPSDFNQTIARLYHVDRTRHRYANGKKNCRQRR